MTMDTIITTLACFLLALSFAVAQTEEGHSTITPTITNSDFNLKNTTTTTTPSKSTVHVTTTSNFTENTTPFTNTTQTNDIFTSTAATKSTTSLQTTHSTTIMTPLTNNTTLTTTATSTQTATLTALTTQAIKTTVGYISTPMTTVITTENSSHTVNTTLDSLDTPTQGLRLNLSDMNMTILFSVVFGVFAMALALFMFHKCKHKIQYLHQPLNNTDDTEAFVADDDTLVISGGLYDGHPIYDNVPPPSTDQSQFRLEFLH